MNEPFFPEFAAQCAALLRHLKNKSVVILGHIRPDGDCVGSQVGLCRLLRQLDIDAKAWNQDPVPSQLEAFIGDTPFECGEKVLSTNPDYVIAVDCSAIDRTGAAYSQHFRRIDLCIDHHISNSGFAEHNWITPQASATAEIIAGIALDCQLEIDAVTAQALYVGIATDTGQFRYPSTNGQVLRIASSLLDRGADAHQAAHELYERESADRLKLLRQYLSTIEFHLDDSLIFGKLSQQSFRDTKTTREQSEGFIDYARNIDSCKIAALLEEQPDGSVKGSLRSKFPEFSVDKLATKFGGGGHACAAGFGVDESFASFPERFIAVVSEHLREIEHHAHFK